MTLATRLILMYLLLFSVPVALTALLVAWRIERDSAERSLAETRQLLDRTATAVNRKLEVLESAATYLIYYRDFLAVLALDHEPSILELLDSKDVMKNVDRIQAVNPDIVRMRVFSANPRLPEMWPFLYNESRVRDAGWLAQVRAKGGLWRLGHREDIKVAIDRNQTTDVLISLFKTVRDDFGQDLGILQVSMTQQAFFDGFLDTAGTGRQTALVDLADGKLRRIEGSPGADRLAGMLEDRGGSGLTGDGEAVLGGRGIVWREIKPLGVSLAALTPEAGLAGNVRLVIVALTLAALCLFSLVIVWGTRLSLRRLDRIARTMRDVHLGRLEALPELGGNDEINDLARAFNEMLGRIDTLVGELVTEQLAVKDAELRALQSQINAHFIYNVLEALRMNALVGYQYGLAEGLEALGRTMRYGMDWKHNIVSLGDELAHVKAYVLLCNLRHDGAINLEIDVPPELEAAPMVKMSLQPLVENAVLHGLAPKDNRGAIRVSARPEGVGFMVRVQDDGAGVSLEPATGGREGRSHLGHGIGLRNVDERIRLAFGSGGVSTDGRLDGLTTFTIHVPKRS
jgi:two-component system sensor histidine kinase YesM